MAEPVPGGATRPSLLLRLRDVSDSDAWQVFVETYAPIVYVYARGKGLQDADAADVAQDVLAQVVRSMRDFVYDPQRGRFRDWLRTVTRNRIFRVLDKRGLPPEALSTGPDEVAADGTDPEWHDEFNAQILRVALERIQPDFESATWRAFQVVWVQNRSAGDAAATLGMPIDLVYAAKSRVLKRLRDEVMHLAEDLPQCVPLED